MSEESKKKLGEEIAKALDSCADALSLNEFSRVTGVRLELLRRFINERARRARAETWDKIYPTLQPFVAEQDEEPEEDIPLRRIGPGYRRHAELVAMSSDQKILLDEFSVLSSGEQRQMMDRLVSLAGGEAKPSEFTSLSAQENALMGTYLSLPQEQRDAYLEEYTAFALESMRRQRSRKARA